MYAIVSASGQWWTGECFGAEQAREEYATIDEMPDTIMDTDPDDPTGPDIELVCCRYRHSSGVPDIRYETEDGQAVAWIAEP